MRSGSGVCVYSIGSVGALTMQFGNGQVIRLVMEVIGSL